MTSVQIGRWGILPTVSNASVASRSDGTLTISGIVDASSLAELQVLRAQVMGLADNVDEPVVPVIVEGASDEWWRVVGVNWEDGPGSYDGLYSASWRVSLESVQARSGVLLESRMTMLYRSGQRPATPWTSVPVSAQGWATSQQVSAGAVVSTTRPSESGEMRLFYGYPLADMAASWRQSASDVYVGAATILAGRSGLTAGDDLPPPAPGGLDVRTPGVYTWVVPPGVTTVRFDVSGASGGQVNANVSGGRGARVRGEITATPGQVLTVTVGASGGRGYAPINVGATGGGGAGGVSGASGNPGRGGSGGTMRRYLKGGFEVGGSGGGGATCVYLGSVSPGNLAVVAGGGGGATATRPGGYAYVNGGPGQPAPTSHGGGGGGTQTAPGQGGIGGSSGATDGYPGSGSDGGVGGSFTASQHAGGGGGGGGYYGGGGGGGRDMTDIDNTAKASGGGGGSCLVPPGGQVTVMSTRGSGRAFLSPVTDVSGFGDPVDGVDYATIVGRQLHSDPWGWQLTNGMVRIAPTYSETEIGFVVWRWLGATWSSPETFGYRRWDSASYGSGSARPTSVIVLRNAPEAVAIRVTYADATATHSHTVDVTLRRGATLAGVTFSSTTPDGWAIVRAPQTTAAIIASGSYVKGIQRPSVDSESKRWVIVDSNIGSGDVDLVGSGVVIGADGNAWPRTVHIGAFKADETPSGWADMSSALGSETVRVVS